VERSTRQACPTALLPSGAGPWPRPQPPARALRRGPDGAGRAAIQPVATVRRVGQRGEQAPGRPHCRARAARHLCRTRSPTGRPRLSPVRAQRGPSYPLEVALVTPRPISEG